MNLIQDRMQKELESLMGFCFIGNSIMDNIVYQLEGKYTMKHTSDIVHHKIAHMLPVLADDISDYVSSRGAYLHRPIVPKCDKEYESLKEIFFDMTEFMVDLEEMTSRAINIAKSENDKMTSIFLEKFLFGLCDYTSLVFSLDSYANKFNYDMDKSVIIDLVVDELLDVH